MTKRLAAACLFLCASHPAIAAADEKDDIAFIIEEGTQQSEAMVTASELMDGIGPRLTNSANMDRAQDWAIAKFADMGLTNIHREEFEFGYGWDLVDWSATMVSPRPLRMTALPRAWSPPTNGVITGEVVVAPMSKVEHFAEWRGKLAGKMVLISMPGETSESDGPVFKRYTGEDISKKDAFKEETYDPHAWEERLDSAEFKQKLGEFLKAEGAQAMVAMSYRDGMLVHGTGYDFRAGEILAVPAMELAQEDYRRLVRLAQTGKAPTISLSIDASFDTEDTKAANVIADIKGRDAKAGYVMAGAHFDSWFAGDGAADNGAGTIVVMEAARILAQLPKPKRTIRFALWSGEEQGLLGSRAYIEQHLATRPVDTSLAPMAQFRSWGSAWPVTKKPGYDDMKAYFNMDNGGGRFRGIHAESDFGVTPLLSKWLAPFASMDADRVVAGKTGGTDHVYLQRIGLPAYQFIQDPLDYFSRVHHSNLDTLDHLRAEDLRQASVVMAGMLWQAANSDEELPRAGIPTEPKITDPFKVADPNK
ncbi:M20/M25/M40 family metallo-hydrolase [Croceicoccus gelatinilyticus]|uniref:M20/M25/M40 family metallo-hydrolase n=1 Tax=Croceicoccus gelatinilyticus TaxID=2835536 RepID=UPI001BCD28E2|nr:M20/M25/M40 family metallo-hydrolase [Croceicoccus gelatinilyticus]MBS7670778.1 M20/M25/M40 family metallo-hydrolase [Croceicoccus gelatinilyticus]